MLRTPSAEESVPPRSRNSRPIPETRRMENGIGAMAGMPLSSLSEPPDRDDKALKSKSSESRHTSRTHSSEGLRERGRRRILIVLTESAAHRTSPFGKSATDPTESRICGKLKETPSTLTSMPFEESDLEMRRSHEAGKCDITRKNAHTAQNATRTSARRRKSRRRRGTSGPTSASLFWEMDSFM